jgi:hypothetical protein
VRNAPKGARFSLLVGLRSKVFDRKPQLPGVAVFFGLALEVSANVGKISSTDGLSVIAAKPAQPPTVIAVAVDQPGRRSLEALHQGWQAELTAHPNDGMNVVGDNHHFQNRGAFCASQIREHAIQLIRFLEIQHVTVSPGFPRDEYQNVQRHAGILSRSGDGT